MNNWNLVTEKLPEEQDEIIVTVHDTSGDTPFDYTTVAWYFDGCWIIDGHYICPYVIAWMELPEPYKLQSTERR